MNQPAAYTPLESLLLFQSVVTNGVDTGAFARISESLISNSLIKDDPTYDTTRLQPDALRQLFLLVIREEFRTEAERGDATADGSPGSRKRKLGTPPLPTLKEVYENVEKIPALVETLYARYRESIVKQIREDERRFENVRGEIQLLERTELERRARAASQNGTPVLASRDAKPVLAPNGPTTSPTPTPNSTTPANVRRGPTPHTPVIPPKPPISHVAPPTVAPPSHLPSGTPPVRPTASPKPPNGSGSVLQPPAGVPQTGPRPLQPPQAHPPKQPLTPRPEVGIKPKEVNATPQTVTPVAAPLKWEKPYQPPQAAHTTPQRQYQPPTQGPTVPPAVQQQQQHQPQQPHPQQQQQQQHVQHPQQQQHWYPQQTAQFSPQTAAQPRPQTPQHAQHQPRPQAAAQHPPQAQQAQQAQHPPQQHAQQQAQQAQHAKPQHQQRPNAPQTPQHQQHPQPPLPQHVTPQQAQHPSPAQRAQQALPVQQTQQAQQHTPATKQPQPPRPQQHQQQQPPRPASHKPVLVPPQHAGQLAPPLQPAPPRQSGETNVQAPQARPSSTTPVPHPSRPIQPPQGQAQQVPRQIASASPTPSAGSTGPIAPPQQRWPPGYVPQQAQHPSPSGSPAPLASKADNKAYTSPYVAQPPRPAIPEHIIRQAVNTPVKRLGTPSTPHTPISATPTHLTHGFGTRWASQSTPSTPRPLSGEPQSPAFEPVSPPQKPAALPSSAGSTPRPKRQAPKSVPKTEPNVPKSVRGRSARAAPKSRGISATPSLTRSRRSQSVMSHTDDHTTQPSESAPKIKDEDATPRPTEDTGDTTADESVPGRPLIVTPSSVSSRLHKRKRQDTPSDPPPTTTQVLWTRGFTKVSSSALDQISSHRDANMFATALREKDAPNYHQIVLQPQDITSIRSAIKHGNKAAVQAAAGLPGGDPGTAHVWLPLSDELVPPKGIINSAQLERELVHMFCNAIMYNPDPDRGPGPAFMKRSQDEEEEVVGYRLDENGVVKNTRSMFVEVEKLLGELRSAEKERSAPPPSTNRPASVATPAEETGDDDDEPGERETGTVKRRRIGTRG
ncbi:hypothetical protein CDV31_014310 [Fusarium ambrosium]|uniref:Bromo domain-containing protein n=1 Tax=Fusarium ambrosium TaxID=131363 RepID=A0A428SXB9_9HYPO|nr:hypothetical protein CDV31_014310 [Fusarium ambrosium]